MALAVFLRTVTVHLAILSVCLSTFAMGQPISWSFVAVPGMNGEIDIELIASAEKGWHLYATVLPSDEGPVPTSFRFTPSLHFVLLDSLVEPEPIEEYDPNFAMVVRYHGGISRFVQRIKPQGTTAFVVEGELEYMCCNDLTCFPPLLVPFRIPVSGTVPHNDR